VEFVVQPAPEPEPPLNLSQPEMWIVLRLYLYSTVF
jgi:hypothetical protein